MNISKNILIIANGKFPKISVIKDILSLNPSIVCCDGAAEKAYRNNINPDVIIGDMDSMNSNLTSKFSNKIIKIDNQDTNDLSKALSWLNERDVDSVTIIGADGIREDHSLGNIFVLLENKYKYKISMINEFGRFDLMDGDKQLFQSFKDQPVSIFCLDKNIKLNSKGLRYPLNDFSFSKLYDASLNASTGEYFEISCNKESINLLVYRANEETR